MATLQNGVLLNSGGLDVKPRSEAQAAADRAEFLTRAAKLKKDPTPMGDIIAAHYERSAAEIKQSFDWRLQNLRDAIHQARKSWRSRYGRFWMLRQENTVRRPSWRVEMETSAWKAARAEVRRYGELRAQLHDLLAEGPRDLPVVRMNLVEKVEG